jgi:hypothetical protein
MRIFLKTSLMLALVAGFLSVAAGTAQAESSNV